MDIYSFGVVLLELITGKHPCDDLFKDSGISLPQWVRNVTLFSCHLTHVFWIDIHIEECTCEAFHGLAFVLQVRNKVSDDNNIDEVLDDVLVNTCSDEEVTIFVDTALFCTNTLPSHRPSMAQVAKLLETHQSPRPSVGNDSMASSSYTFR